MHAAMPLRRRPPYHHNSYMADRSLILIASEGTATWRPVHDTVHIYAHVFRMAEGRDDVKTPTIIMIRAIWWLRIVSAAAAHSLAAAARPVTSVRTRQSITILHSWARFRL
jgi:hypothetical protein